MLSGGEVVGESDTAYSTRDSLLVDVPFDPDLSTQNDILTMLDFTDAVMRVRPLDGGPVVAVDRSIATLIDGCDDG